MSKCICASAEQNSESQGQSLKPEQLFANSTASYQNLSASCYLSVELYGSSVGEEFGGTAHDAGSHIANIDYRICAYLVSFRC